jgi:hypothetical protein
MNKVEQREIKILTTMHQCGMIENVALGLSSLIRCAMTKKSKAALMEYATIFNVANHPQFII